MGRKFAALVITSSWQLAARQIPAVLPSSFGCQGFEVGQEVVLTHGLVGHIACFNGLSAVSIEVCLVAATETIQPVTARVVGWSECNDASARTWGVEAATTVPPERRCEDQLWSYECSDVRPVLPLSLASGLGGARSGVTAHSVRDIQSQGGPFGLEARLLHFGDFTDDESLAGRDLHDSRRDPASSTVDVGEDKQLSDGLEAGSNHLNNSRYPLLTFPPPSDSPTFSSAATHIGKGYHETGGEQEDQKTLTLPRAVVVTPVESSIPHANISSRFDYHKDAFPLDWRHDGITLVIASVGLIIAASGGIGGGGILVPIFMLVLGFRPKHAVALSNITILGGAIANTSLNAQKRHPAKSNKLLIDWDIIVMMEPLTIFGAVFGSLLSKVLPNIILNLSLVAVLAFMGRHTLKKGVAMWNEESRLCGSSFMHNGAADALSASATSGAVEMALQSSISRTDTGLEHDISTELPYLELDSDSEAAACRLDGSSACSTPSCPSSPIEDVSTRKKIAVLTLCFVGICGLTLMKGGGSFASPLGFECGSKGFWLLYFGVVPWVLVFALYFRYMLVSEFEQKVRQGHVFLAGEVQWNRQNSLRYPALCALSGLLAGLFGVGGGIVKGPLMLEMGVIPVVASASAAAMILYTSAAASISFIVFGLLHPVYGTIFFFVGLVCTAFGQCMASQWVSRHQRQSPVVLSIGTVISTSACLVAMESLLAASTLPFHELFHADRVCSLQV